MFSNQFQTFFEKITMSSSAMTVSAPPIIHLVFRHMQNF